MLPTTGHPVSHMAYSRGVRLGCLFLRNESETVSIGDRRSHRRTHYECEPRRSKVSYPVLKLTSLSFLFGHIDARYLKPSRDRFAVLTRINLQESFFHDFKPVLWPLTERLKGEKSKLCDKLCDKQTALTRFRPPPWLVPCSASGPKLSNSSRRRFRHRQSPHRRRRHRLRVPPTGRVARQQQSSPLDRKSTRLNSSHVD